MFNNSSNVDASHSTFSEVHRDQYYNARSTVQGNQTINTVIHGNQIQQDSHSNLLEALQKASAPSAAHDSAQRYPAPKCLDGTRVELLARLTSWVDGPDQTPMCWLNGRPGSGKSAVSQTIAEKYANQGRLAASFFFSRRDLERRTTQHVVPTLTTQLLGFLPSIRPAVIAALESDYMLPMKVLREQMEKLLLGPLSTATETPGAPLLIVVDALDECDDESLVSELVTLLALLPRKTSLPLRLLITSRSEPWLQSQFHRPDISALTLPLEIHAFSAEADIRSFLRRALDDTYDQHLQVMNEVPRPWPSSDELEHIVNKAGGLFIFALTVVKFVGDKPFSGTMASVSGGSAYTDLDSLYRGAISVFPDPDVARLVLGVVYCMAIPLSVSGLHKLLQKPDFDARIVVPALSSVLLASEDRKQPIQFYHASFRDFLINPQRSQKYAINPDAYHRFMAQLCLETMSNSLKRDMCGIGDPANGQQRTFDEALLYACRFWSRHLALLPSDGVASEALLGTTVLLCWIEALSIFGELENAVVMLREGISWLKTLREVPKDALTLLEDADRLVVLYMDCISQCALHVHLTAISLVPMSSAIHKTFIHQSIGKVILKPDRGGGWTGLRKSLYLHKPIHSVHGVQVWDVITGGNVASLGDHLSTSLIARFSPSGAFLAAAFEGGTVTVWDPKHEGCHSEPITCLEFSMNCALLASGSRDNAIQALYRLTTHEGLVTSLRLVSGAEDNLLTVNCVAISTDGKDKTTFSKGHHSGIRSYVVAACDGEVLSRNVSSRDKPDIIWATEQFLKQSLKHVPAWQANPLLRPTELRLTTAYATQSPSFVFANLGYLFAGGIPLNTTGTATVVALSSDGNWAAAADSLGSVETFDLSMPRRTWEELDTELRSKPLISANTLIASPDGTRLADADCRVVKRIDVGLMGSAREDDDIRFKFSPDGSVFLCVILSLFSDDRSSVRVFDSRLKKVRSFTASADGTWIASDVFRVASKEHTTLLVGESDDSPINVELVGGSNAGVVHIWDRASGACKATFRVSTSMVTSLAVAIGREDGSLCLWSPSSGDQVTVKNVDLLRFSDDWSRLTSRGGDGIVFIWSIPFDADDADLVRCALCPREDSEGVDGVSNSTSIPHLLSQSDPGDVVDSHLNTTYRVRKDGWLVKGDRRVIWLPPSRRPRGKDTFYAYENGQVVFALPALNFFKWVDE
ncbi:hypothetical protein HD554DRAFT_2097581 [Boletus coccyginus]|nr:hypothetical protein HD554DRAFT_2097581 [Boletus coccyginus]